MFLDYLALAIGLVGLILVFYTFIYIHDIPYQIAKKRNHPQVDAIHAACWLSLFTLEALWPLVFLWAISRRQQVSVAMDMEDSREAALRARVQDLEGQVAALAAAHDEVRALIVIAEPGAGMPS